MPIIYIILKYFTIFILFSFKKPKNTYKHNILSILWIIYCLFIQKLDSSFRTIQSVEKPGLISALIIRTKLRFYG